MNCTNWAPLLSDSCWVLQMKVLAGDQKVEGGSSWGIYSPGVPTAWLGAGGDCVVLPEARALGGPLNRSLSVSLTTPSSFSFRSSLVTDATATQIFYHSSLVSFNPAHTFISSPFTKLFPISPLECATWIPP